MKAIIISDDGSRHYKLKINIWMLFIISVPVLFLAGFSLNKIISGFSGQSLNSSDIQIIKRFDSYLKRLAVLEAQTQRLNALGARIAQKNNIDIDTFLLEKEPARGGIVNHSADSLGKDTTILSEQDLIKSIKLSELALARQERAFKLYRDSNTTAANRKLLQKTTVPAEFHYSSPVVAKKGYISSNYGYRRDPINGLHRFHGGIDIAGKTGTQISAIASGFVSFTGRKGGYGNVVEINHSDSLKSRYAHLSSILVKKGQVVRKGDTIGKMGSTGRVTGPHLHLEVWKNGKTVNPMLYLKDALRGLNKS